MEEELSRRAKRFSTQQRERSRLSLGVVMKLCLFMFVAESCRMYVGMHKQIFFEDPFSISSDAPTQLKNTITIVDTTKYRPTVFACWSDGDGFAEAKKIFESVLPEYDFVHDTSRRFWRKDNMRKMKEQGRNNQWDFFLMPLNMMCKTNGPWLLDDFEGNIIMISGESVNDYVPYHMERKYLIGPWPEGDRTMTLTYLQMVWYQVFRPIYETTFSDGSTPESVLVEASKRPQGKSEKNFLIYAASNCVEYREEAFMSLSTIAPANFGGKCKGSDNGDWTNRTNAENNVSLRNWSDNVNFYGGFRFCLVMEHSKEPEYVTEKILMAFLGGCIPIYYGSELIFEFFNRESFVFYDVQNPQPAIDLVRKLESDPVEYKTMLSKPILANGNKTVAKWFSFSDDIGGGELKNKIRKKLGIGSSYQFVNNATMQS